jgi:hypothetical protein
MNLKLITVGLTVAVASLGALAQAASAAEMPRVDKREAHQQQRIEQGVASGQLTPKETQRLEKEQGAIAKAETKAKADGTVTKKERMHLHRMQDRASRDIARQKHDGQTVAPAQK